MSFARNCLAAALFLAVAGTARAQDTRDADLRCLAVMAKINQLQDQVHQIESFMGGYYFMGRIQAVAPEIKLGASTVEAYNKMSPSEFISETQRCEQEMRSVSLSEIGRAMPKAQPEGK